MPPRRMGWIRNGLLSRHMTSLQKCLFPNPRKENVGDGLILAPLACSLAHGVWLGVIRVLAAATKVEKRAIFGDASVATHEESDERCFNEAFKFNSVDPRFNRNSCLSPRGAHVLRSLGKNNQRVRIEMAKRYKNICTRRGQAS